MIGCIFWLCTAAFFGLNKSNYFFKLLIKVLCPFFLFILKSFPMERFICLFLRIFSKLHLLWLGCRLVGLLYSINLLSNLTGKVCQLEFLLVDVEKCRYDSCRTRHCWFSLTKSANVYDDGFHQSRWVEVDRTTRLRIEKKEISLLQCSESFRCSAGSENSKFLSRR